MSIEPGLYPDMSNDAYHGIADWWGSTQLKTYLPEHYKPFSGNTEALSFGTLVHTLALEPEQAADIVALDAVTIGVKADGTQSDKPLTTAAWKKAVAEVEQDGKTVVAKADWDRAVAMVDAIHDHPVAGPLLFSDDGISEESAFWRDDQGIGHKARFDRRIPGALVDLKTTSAKPGAHSLTRASIDYGYDLSAAHYVTVAEGLGIDVDAFCHVWVTKDEPYRVTVTEMSEDFLARGRVLRALALERATNPNADAYQGASGYLTLSPPKWARLTEEIPA